MKPTLYILRGLPGSGKSTLARKLVSKDRHRESDTYHMIDGKYCFDPNKADDAGAWCKAQVVGLLMSDLCDVAVARTFMTRASYEGYMHSAKHFGYNVQVIDCHGEWESIHSVPNDVLDGMRRKWEPHNPDEEHGGFVGGDRFTGMVSEYHGDGINLENLVNRLLDQNDEMIKTMCSFTINQDTPRDVGEAVKGNLNLIRSVLESVVTYTLPHDQRSVYERLYGAGDCASSPSVKNSPC